MIVIQRISQIKKRHLAKKVQTIIFIIIDMRKEFFNIIHFLYLIIMFSSTNRKGN